MSSDSDLPLVTFGKYKGKPVTEMLADTKYVEWCKQQEFFKKHTTIYNICVNQTIGSQQASKTPEHNRIQNLFLDNKRVVQFYRYVYTHLETYCKYSKCVIHYMENEIEDSEKTQAVFEGYYNWDIIMDGGNHSYTKHKWKCDHDSCNESCYYDNDKGYYDIPSMYIEIKPLVGDDYPSILRKMKTQIDLTGKKLAKEKAEEIKKEEEEALLYGNRDYLKWLRRDCKRYIGRYYLLIRDYQSTTTTKEKLVKIFGQSDIRVVFLHDIFPDLPSSSPSISSDEKTDVMAIQMTPTFSSAISPPFSSSSDERIDMLERRIARLESLLAKMGVHDEE